MRHIIFAFVLLLSFAACAKGNDPASAKRNGPETPRVIGVDGSPPPMEVMEAFAAHAKEQSKKASQNGPNAIAAIDNALAFFDKLTCDQVGKFFDAYREPSGITETGRQLDRLIQTFVYIRRCALNEKTSDDLFVGQLRGMAQAVGDPHSAFLPLKETKQIMEALDGQFVGIGAELQAEMNNGRLLAATVVSPIPGSPAERGGIKAKDLIVEVDGKKSTSFKDLDEMVSYIRGHKGEKVQLTVMRAGESAPLVFSIVRDDVVMQYVKTSLLPDGWALIKLSQFEDNKRFCANIENSYHDLEKKHKIEGVVLDLRNDPGGLLNLAACTLALFAPPTFEGKSILAVEDRGGVHDVDGMQFTGAYAPKYLLKGKTLVVLVNGGSASASEVVAKWLQGAGVGIVVGTDPQTFGKGSIQSVFEIGGDKKMMLKLTTAQYLIYNADGKLMPVQGVGVTPNILVKAKGDKPKKTVLESAKDSPASVEKEEKSSSKFLREKELSGSIATSTHAVDIPPVNIKVTNPTLYEKILKVLKSPELNLETE